MGWEVYISSHVLKNPLFEKVCFAHSVPIKRRWCRIQMYDHGLYVLMSNCSKYLNSKRCWVYSSHRFLCQQLNPGNQRWFLEPTLCNQGCGEMQGEHGKPGKAFWRSRKCFLEELLIQGYYISTTGFPKETRDLCLVLGKFSLQVTLHHVFILYAKNSNFVFLLFIVFYCYQR